MLLGLRTTMKKQSSSGFVVEILYETFSTEHAALLAAAHISSSLCHQRAGWWWKGRRNEVVVRGGDHQSEHIYEGDSILVLCTSFLLLVYIIFSNHFFGFYQIFIFAPPYRPSLLIWQKPERQQLTVFDHGLSHFRFLWQLRLLHNVNLVHVFVFGT